MNVECLMMNDEWVFGSRYFAPACNARMGFTTKVVFAFEVLSSFFPLLKQWAYFFGLGPVIFEHALTIRLIS